MHLAVVHLGVGGVSKTSWVCPNLGVAPLRCLERENSESFISEHTNAEVLEIDGMFKVSIGSFSSLNDASSHIEAYRDEFGEDIWVLNY